MHVLQAALALLASGAAVLIIAGLVRESVHDKKHLSRSSVGTPEQPAVPPLRTNPELSESEILKSADPDPVAPASRGKRERRKKHRAADGGDRDARRRRREAKRRERGERSGQRAKEAGSGASAEAEDG